MISINYIPVIRNLAENTSKIGKRITNFEEFGIFCRQFADENQNPSIEHIKVVKRPLMMLEDAYKKKGNLDSFCLQTTDLANELHAADNNELANIMFSEVAQNANGMKSSEVLFDAINSSIEISKMKDDKARIIGRLTELGNLYEVLAKGEKDKKKLKYIKNELYKTLIEKKAYIREILDDYEGAKSNYVSIKRPFPEIRGFILQMAFVKEKLAKFGKNNNQNKADRYYKEVGKLYKEEDLKRMELYVKNAINYKNRNLSAEGRSKITHTSKKANREVPLSIESDRRIMKKQLAIKY